MKIDDESKKAIIAALALIAVPGLLIWFLAELSPAWASTIAFPFNIIGNVWVCSSWLITLGFCLYSAYQGIRQEKKLKKEISL